MFAIITEEEDRKSTVRNKHVSSTVCVERLLPYSIWIGLFSHLQFEFAGNPSRGRQVVETLLKETFPEVTFEWAKPYIPPPSPTPEEIRKRERQIRLERLKSSLTPLDHQILELRRPITMSRVC
ncbi:MAG: hypothetical protein NWF14_02425 [Candidatus Bathyarchaeota archaeon]|nr:hypothetical protein [Candidatus Bathyarchaeota archaeon]